jgi:hypothetical protein
MKIPYAVDPKSNKPSATLSLMLISYLLFVTLIVLESIGKINGISASFELFMVSTGAYVGRKTFKSKKIEVKE